MHRLSRCTLGALCYHRVQWYPAIHVRWHPAICARVASCHMRSSGTQPHASNGTLSYALKWHPATRIQWHPAICAQMASSHTQYALAFTDSLIRFCSLLLLCGVSSAACVTGSFPVGTQLARPHSASVLLPKPSLLLCKYLLPTST